MDRLIPAGTGMEHYRNVKLQTEEPPPAEEAAEEVFEGAEVYNEEIGRGEATSS
jgi:hypothetical protein